MIPRHSVLLFSFVVSILVPLTLMAADMSYGTGFFIKADGTIVTNHHVINGSNKISISYSGQLLDAKLLKEDPVNDIAILKVQGHFPFFKVVDSEKVKMGDDVMPLAFPIPICKGYLPK